MPKTNKKFATLMDFLSENSATNVENIKSINETITSLKDLIVEGSNINERSIQSISGELSSLKDLLIEDRNLKSKLIQKELRLKEISTKSKVINTAFQDELDQIKSKRREIDSEIKSLLQEEKALQKKEKESQEEKATYFRRTAKSEIESGNLISGLLFSFLGRNEPTKESLEEETKRSDREERRKRLEFLENEKLENQKERKQLRDDIKTTLVTSLSPVAKLLETDAKEEISQQYEQKDIDLSPKPIVIQSIIDPVTVKIEELSKQSLESLKKLLESVEFNTTGSSGGILQNLPMPVGGMSGITRVGGKLLGKALPIAAVAGAAYGAVSGATNEGVNATLSSRKRREEAPISNVERLRSARANAASVLTLGLIDPKNIADAFESPIGKMIEIFDPITLLSRALDNLVNLWPFRKPQNRDNTSQSGSDGIRLPTNIDAAVNKVYADKTPQQSELIKKFIKSESGGDVSLINKIGAAGLGQFLPSTALEVAKKMKESRPDIYDALKDKEMKSIKGDNSMSVAITKLSPEQQIAMIDQFFKPLFAAKPNAEFADVKAFGFASGKYPEALAKKDMSMTMYDKSDRGRGANAFKSNPIFDEWDTNKNGKLSAAELRDGSASLEPKNSNNTLKSQTSAVTSKNVSQPMMKMETPITIEMLPSAEGKKQPMMKMETPITIERLPSAEELSGYNKTKIVKPNISSEQKISLKPINTPSLSEMNTTSNIRGSQTYEKATESVALKESSMNPGMAVVSNTFNTNNQQISQQQSVRKAPADTSNPFQNTYNKLIWS
jgi:hypothetical protein